VRGPTILGLLIALVVLGGAFAVVERLFRRVPAPPWWRRPGVATDLAYGLFAPFVGKAITRVGVGVAALVVVLLAGKAFPAVRAEVEAGRFPDLSVLGLGSVVRAWPFAVQLLAGLFVGDLVAYATHRAFHRRALWRFHAVHHSSARLDWLASVRVHPVNDLLARMAQAVPLLLLGFDPAVFLLVAPLTTLYALLLHADVDWTYGPLRYAIASPVFHRWHHAADLEARDANFAGFFPVIDLAFGTYHMPVGRRPAALGVAGDPVPPRFLAQLAWPFRRRRAGGAVPAA